MKRNIRIVLTILLIQTILIIKGNTSLPSSASQDEFPEKVSGILARSCYDCHTTGTQAKKAFETLDFKKWEGYKLTKKISLLTKICEVAEGGDMPPEKYLNQHTEKVLSASDIETICNWTKKESEKLIK